MPRTKKRIIEKAWQGYKDLVLPAGASETQIKETRLAFFSGASTLYQVIMTGLSAGDDAEPGDLQLLSDVSCEIAEFGKQLDLSLKINSH